MNKNRGFLLVTLMITTSFIVVIGLATTRLALSNFQVSDTERNRVNAQMAADAGVDHALYHLNASKDDGYNYTGSGSEITLYEDANSKIAFITTIEDGSEDTSKFIHATGRYYQPKDSPTPRVERAYEVELRGIESFVGEYSVVTGVGGLVMGSSSGVVGGDVYVNGKITMGSSTRIGLSTNPVDVRVAHYSCPSTGGSTYPRVCNPGENMPPISIGPSASINGSVQATNQISGAGMSNPGLQAGSPPPLDMPEYDRAAQIAAMAHTGSPSCKNPTTPVTWQANTRINGDYSVSAACTVTVRGDVWITGNLTIGSSSRLVVANDVTEPPVVMVDGSNGLRLNAASQLVPNSSGIGFKVITYHSAGACAPNCSDLTGADLKNSQNLLTIDVSSSATASRSELYARWSRVRVSSSASVGAVAGQTVELGSSAQITFSTNISGLSGSAIESWVIKNYKHE